MNIKEYISKNGWNTADELLKDEYNEGEIWDVVVSFYDNDGKSDTACFDIKCGDADELQDQFDIYCIDNDIEDAVVSRIEIQGFSFTN